MAKKKKGGKKKKVGAKAGKKPKTPQKKSKKGGAGKKGKKGKKSKSPPTTAENLGEGPLITEPVRTYVPEFSGNVYFRTFQVSNPKALLEMSRRHGTTRSKRILGPLKKISAEEQRIADEIDNAAASVAQKMQDLEQIQHGGDSASRPTTATKSEGGGKKKKKGKKTPKGTPKGSRPGSPAKSAKKKGTKKGKKKSKSSGSKNTTPANSRPGTSNGGGEGEGDGHGNAASGGAGTVNRRGGNNYMNDYGELLQAPPYDWSAYDQDMANKRLLGEHVLLAAAGNWKPPAPAPQPEEVVEAVEGGADEDGLFPAIGGVYDEFGELVAEEQEEEDPVKKASWVLVRGEPRFSQKYRLKAETKAIYNGVPGFRSLSINKTNCERYGWEFNANKESMEAFVRLKPQLKFGAF